MKKTKILLSLIVVAILITSCKDDRKSGGDACNSDFDQKAMFENIADNIIIPDYTELAALVDNLHHSASIMATEPILDADNLLNAQLNLIAAWKKWQKVAQFSFGPAEDVFLRNSLNNFPLNLDEIITKIESGSTDFSSPDDFDKGFPALDYLLFGVADTNENILDFYKNPDNADYANYLKAVAEDIKSRVDNTLSAWQSGYAGTFKSNTGTAAGTSLSQIINGLNQNYELIKREKLGVPSGVLTLGFPNPDKVEAPYSGISTELAKIALTASRDLYTGTGLNGIDGLGPDDYLTEIGSTALHESIKDQFASAFSALNLVGDDLAHEVEENQSRVTESYNEITKNLVHLKTDMPSVLCVSITYIDNPSDSD